MRVAHVSDFYAPRVGGIERQVGELAAAQAAAGHEVHVLTATQVAAQALSDLDPVIVHRLPAGGAEHTGLLASPGALRAVGRAVTDLKPDVVHVHASVASPLALVAALAASRAGLPTVVTVHSMWAHLARPYRSLFGLLGLTRLPICWTAVSAVAAAQVREAVGAAHHIHVVPNGIDPSRWTPPEPAGQRADRPVHVVSVLRLAPRKRPLAVLRALRRSRAQLPAEVELRATLVGGGPLRVVCQAYARAHRMPWVSLPGTLPVEGVRAVLAEADVFVSAARLESFGIAALEARCAGVPVVGLAGTGVEDFVAHGREGIIAAGDAALAEALTSLVGSAQLRAAMTAHNRRALPAASWEITIAAAEAVYEEAATLVRGALPTSR